MCEGKLNCKVYLVKKRKLIKVSSCKERGDTLPQFHILLSMNSIQ